MLQKIDIVLFYFINGTMHSSNIDPLMIFITQKPYALFFIILLLIAPKYRTQLILPVALSLLAVGFSDSVGNVLKHLVDRERPFAVLSNVNKLVSAHAFSFPSNHAANAFAFAAGVSYFIRIAALPLLGIALVVAFSRIYVGVHYPSDALSGSLLGIGSFFIVLCFYRKIKTIYEQDRYKASFYILLLAFLILRLFYINYGPLHLAPDEAHYWEWSRRLDWSYYSKGPIIAYLIALTTKLGGDNVFSVRLLAPFLLCLSSLFVYKLSNDMFGNNKIGILSGLLLQLTPLFATYGVIMTIDSPFLFFWSLALWLFWKAINVKKPIYWYLTGIIIGAGFLTKYIMLFFYLCAFIFVVFSKKDQFWLKRIHPYLSFVLSLSICSPLVIWNAFHGWVTALHTTDSHIRIHDGLRFSLKSLSEFVGTQVGVITPFLGSVIFYMLLKYRKSYLRWTSEKNYLFSFSLPILFFFLLKSVHGKVEANWAMVSYPSLFVLSSFYLVNGWKDFSAKLRFLVYFSLLFSFLFSAASHFPAMLNLPPRLDPSARLRGWKELGIEVSKMKDSLSDKGHVFIFSDQYQVSSELAFYVKGNPRTYCINLGRRMNQYDLWPDMNAEFSRSDPQRRPASGRQNSEVGSQKTFHGIFVRMGDRNMPSEVKESFDRCEKRIFPAYENGYLLRKYSIFTCFHFKGLKTKKPLTY